MTEVINPQTGEVLSAPNSSPTIGKLAEALAKAQGEMKPPKATRTATVVMTAGGQYSYKYADLSDVLQSARDALSNNGLAVLQTYEASDPLLLVTTLCHSSGEWMRSILPVRTQKTATDKSGRVYVQEMKPQDIGSSMTFMRRYALSALIGIAAEEDDDGKGAGSQKTPSGADRPRPNTEHARVLGAPVKEKPAGLDIDPAIDASEKCPGPKYKGKVWIDFPADQLRFYVERYGALLATGRLDAKLKTVVTTAKKACESALQHVLKKEGSQ